MMSVRERRRRDCVEENLSKVYNHINNKRIDPFSASRRTDATDGRASQRRGYTDPMRFIEGTATRPV
jgi:hypothetical protein